MKNRKLWCGSKCEFDNLMEDFGWKTPNDVPVDCACISISGNQEATSALFGDREGGPWFSSDGDRVLNLVFDDIGEDYIYYKGVNYYGLKAEDCPKIVEFIERNLGKDFYIHCHDGKSRSQGIVRFILDSYPEYNYQTRIENPCLTPNIDVVSKLKRVLWLKQDTKPKHLVFCAPSGSGKSTMVKWVLENYPEQYELSISATTRKPRGKEIDSKDYFFLGEETFKSLIEDGKFLEHEEVYPGCFYGTLNSELIRIKRGILFDVDIKGALSIKRALGNSAITIFVCPPSIDVLRDRLIARGDTSLEDIETRLKKAEEEMSYKDEFDVVLINSTIDEATQDLEKLIKTRALPLNVE